MLWIILAGVIASLWLPTIEQLEARYGLGQLMRWRGELEQPEQLAIVAINEETATRLGKGRLTSWSRQVYADLVERLHAAGVKTIVFDIYFAEARGLAGDQAFADAIKSHGNVVLFAYSERKIRSVTETVLVEIERLQEPLGLLKEASKLTAPFVLPKVPAQVVSFSVEHGAYPPHQTLPLAALELSHPDIRRTFARFSQVDYWYNFYGPPKTIITLALDELVNQQAPDHIELEGYTVFVGYSSNFQPEQEDSFQTAFTTESGHDLSGVELAATAYANLRDQNYVKQGSFWLWPLCVFVYALAGFLLAWYIGHYLLLALTLLATVYTGVVILLFNGWTIWLPWLIPLVFITPGLAAFGYQHRLVRLQRQRTSLQRAFGRYVPATEIDLLLNNPNFKVADKQLYGVCMVTDAKGYTGISEKLETAALSALMQEYLATIIEPIRQSGGIISDVTGDGVIAVWPQLQRESAYQTIAPVIKKILKGVDDFNQKYPQYALPTRMGIHAGELLLGHFGAADHFEYRAIGDIVNTASRIEQANKILGTQVLISGDCLSDRLNPGETSVPQGLRYLGPFYLAGKSIAVPLYTRLTQYNELQSSQYLETITQYDKAIKAWEDGDIERATVIFTELMKHYPDEPTIQFAGRHIINKQNVNQRMGSQLDGEPSDQLAFARKI